MNVKPSGLEEIIGYEFKDKKLLNQALSHSSYANERGLGGLMSNERLEFLGDAVLEIVSSEILFNKYPDMKEGELSKLRARLVCELSLSQYAKRIELPTYILLGRGEEKTGGRERASIISDCLESLIGAIYIDSGMEQAKAFVEKYILFDIENASFFSDNKTALQEVLQRRALVPKYALVKETGPSHNKVFTVSVSLDGSLLGEGSGRTKKAAEQIAAGFALLKLKEMEDVDVS